MFFSQKINVLANSLFFIKLVSRHTFYQVLIRSNLKLFQKHCFIYLFRLTYLVVVNLSQAFFFLRSNYQLRTRKCINYHNNQIDQKRFFQDSI